MKKAIPIMALFLCLSSAVMAQTPPVPTRSSFNSANQTDKGNSVKGAGPIAPATLLLLGLAGGFAGVKVYRNSKKEEE
mgnify:CR=1